MGVTIVTYYRKTIVVMHICTVVYTQCTTQTLRFNLLAGGNQNIAFVYFSRARCCCCLFFGWCDRFFRYYKSENRLTNLGSRRLSRFHKWNTISPIVIFFSSQKKFFFGYITSIFCLMFVEGSGFFQILIKQQDTLYFLGFHVNIHLPSTGSFPIRYITLFLYFVDASFHFFL